MEKWAKLQYVGLATGNEEYYVGIDMPSAMHHQTILAYEVNEKPLSPEQGQPLRLIIPVKYGIKNLKRIGSISFSNQRRPIIGPNKVTIIIQGYSNVPIVRGNKVKRYVMDTLFNFGRL